MDGMKRLILALVVCLAASVNGVLYATTQEYPPQFVSVDLVTGAFTVKKVFPSTYFDAYYYQGAASKTHMVYSMFVSLETTGLCLADVDLTTFDVSTTKAFWNAHKPLQIHYSEMLPQLQQTTVTENSNGTSFRSMSSLDLSSGAMDMYHSFGLDPKVSVLSSAYNTDLDEFYCTVMNKSNIYLYTLKAPHPRNVSVIPVRVAPPLAGGNTPGALTYNTVTKQLQAMFFQAPQGSWSIATIDTQTGYMNQVNPSPSLPAGWTSGSTSPTVDPDTGLLVQTFTDPNNNNYLVSINGHGVAQYKVPIAKALGSIAGA